MSNPKGSRWKQRNQSPSRIISAEAVYQLSSQPTLQGSCESQLQQPRPGFGPKSPGSLSQSEERICRCGGLKVRQRMSQPGFPQTSGWLRTGSDFSDCKLEGSWAQIQCVKEIWSTAWIRFQLWSFLTMEVQESLGKMNEYVSCQYSLFFTLLPNKSILHMVPLCP